MQTQWKISKETGEHANTVTSHSSASDSCNVGALTSVDIHAMLGPHICGYSCNVGALTSVDIHAMWGPHICGYSCNVGPSYLWI